MKFSEMPYSRPDLEAMKANLTACTEAFLAAESAQEQIAQYDRVTDLSVEFNTMGSLANARHTIDTRDAFYDAESTFFDESWPQLSVYFQRLNEAMLDSKFRPELEAHYGSLLFLKLEISRRSFKPELVELMQEENRLTSRYQKLYANMTVEFDGKTMPMPMLGKYKVSADRAVRRAAYEAEGKVFDANRAELDEIYDKLVHNRNAQGRMLGYPNYIQLGYDRLGRNCYGQKELAAFRDPIAARTDRNMAIGYTGQAYLWLDNKASAGGNPWLNPYSDEAVQFIGDLIGEVQSMGFDHVLLENVQFPSAQNGKQDFGSTGGRDRSAQLAADIAAWDARFEGSVTLWYGYSLGQVTDGASTVGGSATALGVRNLVVEVPAKQTMDDTARNELRDTLSASGVEHAVFWDDAAGIFQ